MSQSVHLQGFRDLLDDGGVVDEPGRIAAYTTDQRQLFTGSTFAVLKPATTKQVADIVRLAAHHGIGLVPQGGNTSYCGGATPDASGRQIIVSLERMDRIRETKMPQRAGEQEIAEIIGDCGRRNRIFGKKSQPQRDGEQSEYRHRPSHPPCKTLPEGFDPTPQGQQREHER